MAGRNKDFTANEKDRGHVTLRADGLSKWLRLVFVPYYLKYILLGLALIALVVQAGIFLFNIPARDALYYVALDAPLPSADISDLRDAVKTSLAKVYHREPVVETDTIYVYSSPYVYTSFIGTLNKGEAVMYFVDDGIRELLSEEGNTPFGTEALARFTGRDDLMFLPLSDSPALGGVTEYPLYLAFTRLKDGESESKYDLYIKLLGEWFPELKK